MKATGYLQVIVERRPNGTAKTAGIARVTGKYPRAPLPGALVVRCSIDIPQELADVQTVEGAADAGMMTLVLNASED